MPPCGVGMSLIQLCRLLGAMTDRFIDTMIFDVSHGTREEVERYFVERGSNYLGKIVICRSTTGRRLHQLLYQ